MSWIELNKVDWFDENILPYHVDTRDFHVNCLSTIVEKIDIDILAKYKDRFFTTPEKIKELITKLYVESGGEAKWRCLYLKDKNISHNWNLKYLRIYRTV